MSIPSTSAWCVRRPVGHHSAGACIPGPTYVAAPADDFDVKNGMPEVDPSSAPGDLCLVVEVEPGMGNGEGARYVNLCLPNAMPMAGADVADAESKGLLRRIAADGVLTGAATPLCGAGEIATYSTLSGRLSCAAAVSDPCQRALVPAMDDDGKLVGFSCKTMRSITKASPLPNPCPPGKWLMPDPERDAAFICTNPCPEGSEPHGDGQAFICRPTEPEKE